MSERTGAGATPPPTTTSTGRRLQEGDVAPPFTLATADGGEVSLASYAGRSVVVYFYPSAMTPGCTTQAVDFRDSLEELREAGFDVVGVSPDSPERLQQFADRDELSFPLASDPDHAVLEAYGAWGEKSTYGRLSVGVIRSTVVVGPDGRVVHASYGVKAKDHVARLRRTLGVEA
ncbi:thioredoxin-dependent thiol peroxidase [uncultured Pseudokineococcus sp.]|uniref:thioredoxin-dependent thiol peroxidase n=1 Tax=uncultured Pseudokineococcus sp. TaxID=1642928 RepID=UPI00261582BF|nr:thioredoxin-dependent thiol peroxidase [uncultured Pseudokineococcus sp.]